MINDSCNKKKENENSCLKNVKEFALFVKRLELCHWCFCGSQPQSTIFAVKPRPPARVTACPFFFVKAARFQSHPQSNDTLPIQRWVGGRSLKVAR